MQFLRGQPFSMARPPTALLLLDQKESCLKLLFAQTHTCSSSPQLSFLLKSCRVRSRHPKASLNPQERPAQHAGSYFHVHLEGVSLGQGGSCLRAQAGHPLEGAHVSGAAQGVIPHLTLKTHELPLGQELSHWGTHTGGGGSGGSGGVPTPSEGDLPAKRDVVPGCWVEANLCSFSCSQVCCMRGHTAVRGIRKGLACPRLQSGPDSDSVLGFTELWGTLRLTHLSLEYMHGLTSSVCNRVAKINTMQWGWANQFLLFLDKYGYYSSKKLQKIW